MTEPANEYNAWGTCLDCGYEGLLVYREVDGEQYRDNDALAVMMLLCCPACESEDHTLIPCDYYWEMVSGGEGDG